MMFTAYGAPCTVKDPGLFFDEEREDEAVKACTNCSRRDACLDWSIGERLYYHGVFGGKTPKQRRTIARARGKNVPSLMRLNLTGLPDTANEVVRKLLANGLTVEEIAARTGRPIKAIEGVRDRDRRKAVAA